MVVSCIYQFKSSSMKSGPLRSLSLFSFIPLLFALPSFLMKRKRRSGSKRTHTQRLSPPPHSTPSNISAQWPGCRNKRDTRTHTFKLNQFDSHYFHPRPFFIINSEMYRDRYSKMSKKKLIDFL